MDRGRVVSMSSTDNPFFEPSDLAYQLPPFDRITEEHYLPAFERGMAEHRAEIAEIAANAEQPTVDNTLVALERSGQILTRVRTVFWNQAGSDTNPAVQELEAELSPRLAAHHDAIYLDEALFARVKTVYEQRAGLGLDPESLRLVERYYVDFIRAGAELPAADKERLKALNEELSGLSTKFGNLLLADSNDSAVVVDTVEELSGLPDDAISAAAEAAKTRGLDGKYLLTLILPTAQPAMDSLTNRELRERLFRAATSRGSRGNDNDTRELTSRIVRLRAQRASLLGHSSHAAYVAEDGTARTVDAVAGILSRLSPVAVANAEAQAADLRAAIAASGADHDLEPWDWAFYAERVRRERFDIDAAELRPYFELEAVLRDGVFFAAQKVYGVTFTERHDLPGYHPDVRVFEVFDEDGTARGLFLGDFYTRDSKRGGAWMLSLVEQSTLLGAPSVVVNNLNIPRPADGEPTLLTFDEVITLFHEFGHALHGLFSDVRYPRFSGTSVPRDFVEYPSQVNEMWILWPEVLANYAKHHQTGEPLPPALVERLLESRRFDEGFATTEYLAAALLDQAWHTLSPDDAAAERVDDVLRFEADALAKAGVAVPTVPPRYRSSYFAHIFSGGYGAGYYSYIWSEVLDADTVEWFTERGGLTRENGDFFRRELLSKGDSVDAMAAFRAFRGRDPEIDPLLQRRGLTG